ncbi:HigA family addiction module antitoxin [Sandaracinobacter sp.]|uniref:HigA family addiction module antitoxin n=1 Tax=Sandaracinobacter sp. TaxID=2487581 RepID=UPI0035B4EEDE
MMEIADHPGGFVKHEVLKAHGLSVTEAAVVLGVTRPALSALVNERAHLSPEMAIRIEKAFGLSMETLIRTLRSQARLSSSARPSKHLSPAGPISPFWPGTSMTSERRLRA